MAISDTPTRDQLFNLGQQYRGIVDELIATGNCQSPIPWQDARFQSMVISALRDVKKYKATHDAVALVGRVSRGEA